jgi:radical SAM superfamily enzyme YgiQ (UPF0313 family)
MYKSKHFKIRDIKLLKQEIDSISEMDDSIRKVFLADGNAMMLPFKYLMELLLFLKDKFPKLIRVSAYASARDLKDKTVIELNDLRAAGLKLIYTGIESGDDEVLKMINKGENYNSIVNNLLKAKEAGIRNSVMILNGLGGQLHWEQHARESARLLNELQPEYLSTLVLSFPYGIKHFQQQFKGVYEPMHPVDLLKEMQLMIEETQLNQVVFRSDHVSNFLVLKGILSKDKERMLNEIEHAIDYTQEKNIRSNPFRGL